MKKLMIERRVPLGERRSVPVLAREGRAAAAGGFGPDRDALAQPAHTKTDPSRGPSACVVSEAGLEPA